MTSTGKLDGVQSSSDYSITALHIITSDGKIVDMTHMYISFNLFEDIYVPYVTGNMTIGDALDIINTMGIHGNEYVYLELDKPSLDSPIKKFFRIYKISDRTYESQALQKYTIHFCSEEVMLSTQKQIRKSYRGMTIDNMIKDILTNQLKIDSSKMGGQFSSTTGNYDIIIPKMQPLEAAMWLTTRAYGDNKSIYFLFENRDGYNFVSYEDLIKQPVYTKYKKAPKVDTNPELNKNSINYIQFATEFDLLKTNRYGGYASSLYTFDIINRSFQVNTFNATQFPDSANIRKNQSLNLNKNRFGQSMFDSTDSMVKFYPTNDSDTGRNPTRPENWLARTAARLANINDMKLVINVPADFMLKVGMLIELDLPKMIPQDGAFENDKFKSGVYMISSVHHGITGEVASTTLELQSDGLGEALPAAIEFSGDLQDVKKK